MANEFGERPLPNVSREGRQEPSEECDWLDAEHDITSDEDFAKYNSTRSKPNGDRSGDNSGGNKSDGETNEFSAGARSPKPEMSIEWFREAADSALSEPANPLIEDLLDEGGFSVVYGDSGSGKTFIVLNMGFHVAAWLPWNGKRVQRGLVVYVAAEGGKRIRRRIAALQKRYRQEYGDGAPDPLLALVRYQIDLRSSDADLNALIALVRAAEEKTGEKCVWLIVDTLSRAMAGGDENSPVDMGRIVAAADRFRAETGAHFTYVHHTGKDAARGARGHSLLRAATDTEIETPAESLIPTKQRDGELGFRIGFKLVDIMIGKDPDGLAVKSAVVEWLSVIAPAANPKREPPPSKRLLMSVVERAIAEAGFDFTPADGPTVRCVKDSVARGRYFARLAEALDNEDPAKAVERKRKAYSRAVKVMLDANDLMAECGNGLANDEQQSTSHNSRQDTASIGPWVDRDRFI
jgi:KaiC/GvpD/RAD55 family RecA-like ATPase